MTCRIQSQCHPAVLVADWVAALSARSPARSCSHVAAFQASSPISHVIPLQLLQTLNLRRWNCSVLSDTRKMTVGNYMRLFRQSPVIPFWSRAGLALVPPWPARVAPDFASSHCLVQDPPCGSGRPVPRHDENGGRRLPPPRLNRSYSWSSPRPRGVIWGHSRSIFASLPCLRRYFSKSSAQSR